MATSAVGWLGLPAVAWAQSGGLGFNTIPQFPQTATVGAADVAASLRMENRSTEEYAFDTFRLTEITVVPNCGSKASAEICEPGARDPGVLVPSATGTGRNAPTPALGGNGCANVTFTITLLTPSDRTDEGRYLFEPVVPAYVGPTDTASSVCTIDFTFHAARAPSIDSDPAQTTPGPLQTDQKARVRGTDVSVGPNMGQDGSGTGTDEVTVLVPTTPVITTQVSDAAIELGESFTDTAQVSDAPGPQPTPTGVVTFAVYGPNDATCTGTPAFTSADRALVDSTATSAPFTPAVVGTYRAVATYGGDANHAPVEGTCNAPNETVVVSAPAAPPRPPHSDTSARGDFNGDGIGDLAVGVPGEDVGSVVDGGAVQVLYGSNAGLSSAGSDLWTQDAPGIVDSVETGDAFGATLSVADFNDDGRDDLAIGVPGENVGAVVDAGAVNVIYGSATGLNAAGNQLWSQYTSGIADSVETNDRFGSALATGDLDGDAYQDLVIGVPNESVGAIAGAGLVHVIPGTAAGLTATGSQAWSQNSAGIGDSAETGDGFGASVSAGDVNGDAHDDLAIGVPGEDVGSVADGGAVNVIYGSSTGLTPAGQQLWTQNSVGIYDSAEAGDRFGSALAIGPLDGDAYADLVVGVPDEAVGAIAGGGVVHVIPGSNTGLTSTGSQYWNQNSAGISDSVESGDGFGASLAIGPIDDSDGQDLAIGVPGEDVGAVADAGAVNVIYGSSTGLTSAGQQLWHQNSVGIYDSVETGDRFGTALVIGDLDGDALSDLAVGVPEEAVGATAGGGVMHVIPGSNTGLTSTGSQYWNQNSAGIADTVEAGDGFGRALGG